MALAFARKKGPYAEINVTPLIDVVLVLLIIFIVLTPSVFEHLSVHMPKIVEPERHSSQVSTPLLVEYAKDGALKLGGEAVEKERFAEELSRRLRGGHYDIVLFAADDAAAYGDVVRMIDIARGAGAQRLAVLTENIPSPEL